MPANLSHIPAPKTDAVEISPALEMDYPASVSTHWMPLHELIEHWAELGRLLSPLPIAPLLTAVSHAFLALAGETYALRLATLASRRRAEVSRGATLGLEYAASCLDRAARDWGLAAGRLDGPCLAAQEQATAAAQRAQRLLRIAQSQQGRLVALAREVRAEAEAWRTQQDSKEVGA